MKTNDSLPGLNVILVDGCILLPKGFIKSSVPIIKEFVETSDGNQVLKLLRTGNFHLVFIIICNTENYNKALIHQVKEKHPSIPIIIIGNSEDINLIRQMYLAGCSGYVNLHSNKSEILKAVHKVMGGKKYFNEDVIEKLILESDAITFERLHRKYDFTISEQKIIQLMCMEKTSKQMADELFISIRTVEKHRQNIYHKAGVKNMKEFLKFISNSKILTVEDIK